MKGSKHQDCVAILISKKVGIKQNITVEIGKDPKQSLKEKKNHSEDIAALTIWTPNMKETA